MSFRRQITLILATAAALASDISAQASNSAQLFTSYNNSFPGGEGLGGFGLTIGTGAIAVRGTFGIGMSAVSAPTPGATSGSRRWAGDADVILADNFGGLSYLLGGFGHPFAFAGVGEQSASASPSIDAAVKTWSYGGGVAIPLGNTIAVEGEARYRSQLGNATATAGDFAPGAEYRVGLSFHFGSSHASRSYGGALGGSPSRAPSGRTGGSRTTWPASGTSAAGAARRVVPDAERYIGVPYRYGGTSPQTGFDCSGFVQYVYARQGVDLPRTSRQMVGTGVAVDPNPRAMTTGDLILFTQGGRISHVAIYAGSGRFIHSSSSGGGVRYDDFSTQRGQWFANHMVAVRRVVNGDGSLVRAFAETLIQFDRFDPPDSAPPVKRK